MIYALKTDFFLKNKKINKNMVSGDFRLSTFNIRNKNCVRDGDKIVMKN